MKPALHHTSVRRPLIAGLIALVVGLGLTALLTREHARLLGAQQEASLGWLAERSATGLRAQLENCALLVRSLQALFNASGKVEAHEFQRMYEDLQPRRLFPALRSLAYARYEPGTPARYPTEFYAPLLGNERVAGLDIATQPANLRALEVARDTDDAAMSEVFDLVQLGADGKPLKGFILRLPVYAPGPRPLDVAERRARFVGSPAASFSINELLAPVLPDADEAIALNVYDISGSAPALLYSSGEAAADARIEQRLIDFAGRRWRLEIAPLPAFSQSLQVIPLVSAGFGIIASLLLGALFFNVARTRETALGLAEQMSQRFRETGGEIDVAVKS